MTPPADPVSEPNAVVVRVAGHPITKATFVHALSVAVKSGDRIYRGESANTVAPQPPDFAACVKRLQTVAPTGQTGSKPTVADLRSKCAQQYQTLLPGALNQLILLQWQIGGAQEDGVHVSDGELQATLNKAKAGQTQAQAEQELATSGRTWADYVLETKAGLYVEGIRRLLKGRVEHVTQAQIAAYYAGHKSLFATPERRDLQIVRAGSRAEALKLKGELAAGKSFASVAKKLTQADQPIYSKEGFVSEYKPGEYLEPPLDHAIFAARPNVALVIGCPATRTTTAFGSDTGSAGGVTGPELGALELAGWRSSSRHGRPHTRSAHQEQRGAAGISFFSKEIPDLLWDGDMVTVCVVRSVRATHIDDRTRGPGHPGPLVGESVMFYECRLEFFAGYHCFRSRGI